MTPNARAEIERLLTRLAGGDRTAITPSFEILWPMLRSFSARALGNDADGEDAAQQALMKLFAQVNHFDPERDGIAWAFTIASFECRTLRRRRERKREVGAELLASAASSDPSQEHVMIERDLEAAAREALADLNEDDARIILAALAENRTAADATLRKRLSRALARLRITWRAKHETRS